MNRWKLIAASALAASTALGAVLGLAALNGGGEAGLGPARLRIGAGYDRRVEPLVAPGFMPSESQRLEAAALSGKALAEAPYDNAARLRLVYLDAIADNRLSPDALNAMRRSYDLVPIDVENGVWRIGFCLTYAGQIPPDLQKAMRNEVAVLVTNGVRRRALTELSHKVPNLMGRFWLALWLRQLTPAVPN